MSYDPSAPANPAGPVVVDSPIPSSPLDAAPIENASAPAVANPLVDGSSPASEVTPAAPVAPVADAWKGELSSQFGISVDGFTNRADAVAAIRLLTERVATTDYSQFQQEPAPPQFQQYGPVPVATPTPPVVPVEIDLTDVDPKLASAIKAIQAQTAAALKQAETANQAYQAHQAQIVQQHTAQVADRASAVLDKLASPVYGVGKNRTFQQTQAVETLGRTVQKLIHGFSSDPRGQMPSIEQVMNLALTLHGHDATARPAAPAAPAVPSQISALTQRALTGNTAAPAAPHFKDPNDPLGLKLDPGFRAGVKAILAANR